MKKIPTVFKRVFDGHKIIDITPDFTNNMCRTAFIYGLPTIKIDGSCCAIISGKLYKRFDAKAGRIIPAGAIKCQDEADPVTGHLPCWVPCNRQKPEDKWFYEALDKRFESERIPDGTYEAVGKHFNANPYGMEYDTLYKHGELFAIGLKQRTFEAVREWLENNPVEGIVFWVGGDPVCKIKRSDFGFEWPCKEAKTGGYKYVSR